MLVRVGSVDPPPLAAAIEFMMDPKFAAHPFAEEKDCGAHIHKTSGYPEDKTCKQPVPVGDGDRGSAIKPGGGKYGQQGQQTHAYPGGSQVEQGFRRGQPVRLIGSGERPAKENSGEQEAA